MKHTVSLILVLCMLFFALTSCGTSSTPAEAQSSKAEEQSEIQIEMSNFYDYFTVQYEFDRSSLILPEGKWEKNEGSSKYDYKDDYYEFLKKNYDSVIKANLIINIKPKIACSVNNVKVIGIPRNKNSAAPLKLLSGWQNKNAYYNSTVYYSDADLILERCTPITITVNSNYEETTKIVVPYTSEAKAFDYDYFDLIPALYITEVSGSITPLNVDTSTFKQVTVNSANFYDYFETEYKFERPMISYNSNLAGIYSYDAYCIMTINIKPKSDNIVSFDGKVSVRYERSDLDIDNTYCTRGKLYTATFDINNGKSTSMNSKDLKIPNLSYVEFDKNDRIYSLTKLNGTALQNFANKYSKIKVTAILPETSIYVLVNN